MSDKIKMENENNNEEYLNNDMYSKIEMYTSFLNKDSQIGNKPYWNEPDEDLYDEKTRKLYKLNSNDINSIEQTKRIQYLEYEKPSRQLIAIPAKKLAIKRLIIVLTLFIIILLLLAKCVSYTNQQLSIKKYKTVIDETHESILKLEEEEAERLRIKAEEEQKAKIANRNIADFTPEQIDKVKYIYTSSEKKVAYLTFDDGPSANVTPLILDVLKQENIKAVFFVLGTNVKWNPEILKRIRQEGHYIANHGYSHVYDQIYKDYDSLINEYNLCEQLIRDALGESNYKTRIFRFPGGSTGGKYAKFKREAKTKMQEQNIIYLDWNALTCDAEGVPTKESILQNLQDTTQGKNNVVILMHDSSTKILTYETLLDVINYLRNQGYEFGDMYDLLDE